MKFSWFLITAVWLCLILLSNPTPVFAQTYPRACPPIFASTLSITEKFTKSDAVFVGSVQGHFNPNQDIPFYGRFIYGYSKVRQRFSLPLPHLNSYPTYTTFQVEKSWKGIAYEQATITTYSTGYQQPWMRAPAGSRWLIMASERDGRWHTDCGLAYEVATADELDYPPFTDPTISLQTPWLAYLPTYGAAVVVGGSLFAIGRRWLKKTV